jgi:phospholipid/cholesterol/gamma-HCH transport system substrate-binding protein
MESKVNYTAVGLFVVLLSIAMVVLGLWLTAGRHRKKYDTYLTYMREAVSGLSEQAPVKYNGVDVGFVKKISLDPKNPQDVRLELRIERDTPITVSTVATLKAQGLTGIAYVGLTPKSANGKKLRAIPPQRYPVIKSQPSLLVQLDAAVRKVSDNMTIISDTIRQVFDKKSAKLYKQTLENTEKFTSVLAKNSEKLNSIVNNSNRILHNTAVASEELPQTMTKVRDTLDNINRLSNNLSRASVDARATLKHSRALIEGLSQQTMPDALQLLSKLNNVANNLDGITRELKRNPSMLLRGKTPTPLGPGEK